MKPTITFFAAVWLIGASVVPAAEFEVVEIRLDTSPAQGLAAQRGKPVELSASRASEFRIVPGMTNPTFVSLELVGAKGHYIRHQGFIVHVQERPKLSPQFDADATFKLIRGAGDKVRFEAVNKGGMFITINEAGAVILAGDRPPERSTFVLKK